MEIETSTTEAVSIHTDAKGSLEKKVPEMVESSKLVAKSSEEEKTMSPRKMEKALSATSTCQKVGIKARKDSNSCAPSTENRNDEGCFASISARDALVNVTSVLEIRDSVSENDDVESYDLEAINSPVVEEEMEEHSDSEGNYLEIPTVVEGKTYTTADSEADSLVESPKEEQSLSKKVKLTSYQVPEQLQSTEAEQFPYTKDKPVEETFETEEAQQNKLEDKVEENCEGTTERELEENDSVAEQGQNAERSLSSESGGKSNSVAKQPELTEEQSAKSKLVLGILTEREPSPPALETHSAAEESETTKAEMPPSAEMKLNDNLGPKKVQAADLKRSSSAKSELERHPVSENVEITKSKLFSSKEAELSCLKIAGSKQSELESLPLPVAKKLQTTELERSSPPQDEVESCQLAEKLEVTQAEQSSSSKIEINDHLAREKKQNTESERSPAPEGKLESKLQTVQGKRSSLTEEEVPSPIQSQNAKEGEFSVSQATALPETEIENAASDVEEGLVDSSRRMKKLSVEQKNINVEQVETDKRDVATSFSVIEESVSTMSRTEDYESAAVHDAGKSKEREQAGEEPESVLLTNGDTMETVVQEDEEDDEVIVKVPEEEESSTEPPVLSSPPTLQDVEERDADEPPNLDSIEAQLAALHGEVIEEAAQNSAEESRSSPVLKTISESSADGEYDPQRISFSLSVKFQENVVNKMLSATLEKSGDRDKKPLKIMEKRKEKLIPAVCGVPYDTAVPHASSTNCEPQVAKRTHFQTIPAITPTVAVRAKKAKVEMEGSATKRMRKEHDETTAAVNALHASGEEVLKPRRVQQKNTNCLVGASIYGASETYWVNPREQVLGSSPPPVGFDPRGPYVERRKGFVVNAPVKTEPRKNGRQVRNKILLAETGRYKAAARAWFSSAKKMDCNNYERDETWMCAFCKKGSHFGGLGDLYGPYVADLKGLPEKNPLKTSRKRSGLYKSETELPDKNEFWFHEDCLVWSPGVFLIGSQLRGLIDALTKCESSLCVSCGESGASLKCSNSACVAVYHVPCSYAADCNLDPTTYCILCPAHKPSKPSVDSSIPALPLFTGEGELPGA